ncbi:unnamed protein product [Trichogramma brassicae]|uniref:Uncharacterized protein n=1 Tax=Trichogramma brassicae TaxID=86971 RepID=A0A6H5IU21_9HYME|nr:unnamed protein product [Trichogramma brassicae]
MSSSACCNDVDGQDSSSATDQDHDGQQHQLDRSVSQETQTDESSSSSSDESLNEPLRLAPSVGTGQDEPRLRLRVPVDPAVRPVDHLQSGARPHQDGPLLLPAGDRPGGRGARPPARRQYSAARRRVPLHPRDHPTAATRQLLHRTGKDEGFFVVFFQPLFNLFFNLFFFCQTGTGL